MIIPEGELLTAEEEQALAIRIQAGDESAIHELVNANLRLIPFFSRRYKNRGHNSTDDDMMAEGAYGLFRAAKSFKPKGLRFSTWARQWITQQISIGIAYDHIIHLPYRTVVDVYKIKQARSRLGPGATMQEIATEAGMDEGYFCELLPFIGGVVSIDKPYRTRNDGVFSLQEFITDESSPTPDETATHNIMREDILKILDGLPKRAGAVIAELYGISDGKPKSLRETGEIFGISGQAVDQLRDKFIAKLRKKKILKEYYDQLGD